MGKGMSSSGVGGRRETFFLLLNSFNRISKVFFSRGAEPWEWEWQLRSDSSASMQNRILEIRAPFECSKIYRKSVLHLLNYRKSILQQMQYRFAINLGTLSTLSLSFMAVCAPLEGNTEILSPWPLILCYSSVKKLNCSRRWDCLVLNNGTACRV